MQVSGDFLEYHICPKKQTHPFFNRTPPIISNGYIMFVVLRFFQGVLMQVGDDHSDLFEEIYLSI